MSKLFMCGSFGCHFEVIDDVAASKANADRIQWATTEKKRHGKFPSESEQIEFVNHAYQRYTNIRRKT